MMRNDSFRDNMNDKKFLKNSFQINHFRVLYK